MNPTLSRKLRIPTALAVATGLVVATVLLTIPTAGAQTEPEPAQACGGGDAIVEGSQSSGFTTTYQGDVVYQGDNYITAIWEAIGSLTPGRTSQEKVSVMASAWIGDNSIDLPSHTAFEVCGTMDVGNHSGNGAVQAIGATDVSIPHLSMTGSPYFGMRFADVHGLHLGQIDLSLSGGMGIRFERDLPGSTDVRMDDVFVSGTNNHGVETWHIDGLTIGTITARDVGYAGLLLNSTRNAQIGTVDGSNVATGTGYATFRMANDNGPGIEVDEVVSRGGGRGIFCVSNSHGAHIGHVDLADNGNNSILIENCSDITIAGGTVEGGGEVRLAARSEFPNNRDIDITLQVNGTSVRESPCGENVTWNLTGSGSFDVC